MRNIEADGVSVDVEFVEMRGASCDIKVMIVCRGNSGSHVSIHWAVGAKFPGEKPETE